MLATRTSAGPAVGLPAGKAPGLFSAITTAGEPVSGTADLQVVAFFSTCPICPERVPPFAEYLRIHRVSRDRVLAVSVGSGTDPQPYLTELARLAQICVEPENGMIARAFEVTGFPWFFLLDPGGVVIASGYDPAKLPEPAAV